MKRKRAKFNLHMAVTMAAKARIVQDGGQSQLLAAADVHTVSFEAERKKAAEF